MAAKKSSVLKFDHPLQTITIVDSSFENLSPEDYDRLKKYKDMGYTVEIVKRKVSADSKISAKDIEKKLGKGSDEYKEFLKIKEKEGFFKAKAYYTELMKKK